MTGSLDISNRQRSRRINRRFLERVVLSCLESDLLTRRFELGVVLVGEAAMARANEAYLGHAGCTDVITFDYAEPAQPDRLAGDILVCVPEAERQARALGLDWREEVIRYVVHGILHLKGYDDLDPNSRKRMKRLENELVSRLRRRFGCRSLCP